ncbi:MAG: phosphatase PAP2 family protein [Candidatus Cryptobacteroides sp.]
MEQLDQTITLWLNGLHCPFTDGMWLLFSNRTVWIPLYLLGAGLMIWRCGWKKGLAMVLLTALAILCVDQFANIIKNLVARPRPCNDAFMNAMGHRLLEGRSRSYSFFSAHAANAIAFAICSAHALHPGTKRAKAKNGRDTLSTVYAVIISIWAAMVGLSRVFVGKHYLGDVLVGFIAGGIIAFALTRLFDACAAKATRTAA